MSTVSKMVLGTAQFALDYGITNCSGCPTKEMVFEILSLAWDRGVRQYDTAPGYGSEALLGQFIRTHGIAREIVVHTKIPAQRSGQNYKSDIDKSAADSLSLLGCEIKTLLFHNASDSSLVLTDREYFVSLQKRYPISQIGVSVYEPHEIEQLEQSNFQLAYQFPFNIVDRRFEKNGAAEGKRYARSIFLQGILVEPNILRSNASNKLTDFRNQYHSFIEKEGLDPVSVAMSFVEKTEDIDYFVVGVDNIGQLNYLLEAELYDRSFAPFNRIIHSAEDLKPLDPRSWNSWKI